MKADIAREFGIPKQKFASLKDFEQDDDDKANPSPPSTSTLLAPVHATPAAASTADDDNTAALAIPHQHLFVATAGELMQKAGDEDEEARNEPQTSPATTLSQSQAPAPPQHPMMIQCPLLLYSTILTNQPSLQRHGSLWQNFGGMERWDCVTKRYFTSLSMQIPQNPVLQVHDTLLLFALKSLII